MLLPFCGCVSGTFRLQSRTVLGPAATLTCDTVAVQAGCLWKPSGFGFLKRVAAVINNFSGPNFLLTASVTAAVGTL